MLSEHLVVYNEKRFCVERISPLKFLEFFLIILLINGTIPLAIPLDDSSSPYTKLYKHEKDDRAKSEFPRHTFIENGKSLPRGRGSVFACSLETFSFVPFGFWFRVPIAKYLYYSLNPWDLLNG